MSETELAKVEHQEPAQVKQVTYIRPRYEVHQNGDYTVTVFMPGVSKSGVNIVVDNKTLSIEGQRNQQVSDTWRARYREIPTADYRLRLDLNIPVDENKISAKTENGILVLKLPVVEAAKPRKIAIS
jgi:HSP20 family protein